MRAGERGPLRAGIAARSLRGAALGLCLLLASCGEGFFHPAAPGPMSAALALPSLSTMAAETSGELAPLLARVNRVQVEVRDRDSDELLAQDDVQVPTTGDIRIVLEVPLEGEERAIRVVLRLLEGNALLFSATSETVVRRGEPGGVEMAPVVVPGGVRIDTPAPSFASLGDTARVQATVVFETGDAVPGAVATWRSTAPTVVSVSADGLATALASGSARLEAVFEDLVADLPVEVRQLPASVEVAPSTLALFEGEAGNLTAVVRDARGNAFAPEDLAWSSVDPAVATVDAAGRVTGVAPGQTQVQVASGGITGSASVTVARRPVLLEVEPTALTLALGATAPLTVRVLDANGEVISDAPVGWSSSAPQRVQVTSDGTVRAVGFGEATVTATSGSLSASVVVTVPRVATSIEVEPASVELSQGDTVVFQATVSDATGAAIEPAGVTWSSTNPQVVVVDAATGVAMAVGGGSADVVARRDGVEGAAQVSVEQIPVAVLVQPSTLFLPPEQSGQLSATVLDATGASVPGVPVAWSSADPQVAEVHPQTGVVTSTGFGTTTVTATAGPASGSATVIVPSGSVTLLAKRMDVEPVAPVGQVPVRFLATVNPAEVPGNVRFRVFGGALGPEGISRLVSYPGSGSSVDVQSAIIDLAAAVPTPGVYTLQTRAENTFQTSNAFDSTIVVVPAPPGLTAVRPAPTAPFQLSWSALPPVSGADYSYQIEFRVDGGSWFFLDSTSDTQLEDETGFSPGTFVQYRISACAFFSGDSAFDCSPWSPPVNGQTSGMEVPDGDLPPNENGGHAGHDRATMGGEVSHARGREPPDEDGGAPLGDHIRRTHAGAQIGGPGGG